MGLFRDLLQPKSALQIFFGVDSTSVKPAPEKKTEQPRIAMSEAARQELGELTRQYEALNRSLEQMLGRLTKSELTGSKRVPMRSYRN